MRFPGPDRSRPPQQGEFVASKMGVPDSVPPEAYVHIEIRNTGHVMSAEVLGRGARSILHDQIRGPRGLHG